MGSVKEVRIHKLIYQLAKVKRFALLPIPLMAKTILEIEVGNVAYLGRKIESEDEKYEYHLLVKSARGYRVVFHKNVLIGIPKNIRVDKK